MRVVTSVASLSNRLARARARSSMNRLFIMNRNCCGMTLAVRLAALARGMGKSNRRKNLSEARGALRLTLA